MKFPDPLQNRKASVRLDIELMLEVVDHLIESIVAVFMHFECELLEVDGVLIFYSDDAASEGGLRLGQGEGPRILL